MRNIITILCLFLVGVSLGSCSLLSTATETQSSELTENQKIPVTLYHADHLCENYTTEIVELSAKDSLEQAISLILKHNSSPDFNIVGYRVKLDPAKQTATIDLRLDANSPRQLISLSPCEQFALFGSLRQTLINHESWQIKELIFTEKGQEIFKPLPSQS